jgi:hypothetical protein
MMKKVLPGVRDILAKAESWIWRTKCLTTQWERVQNRCLLSVARAESSPKRTVKTKKLKQAQFSMENINV